MYPSKLPTFLAMLLVPVTLACSTLINRNAAELPNQPDTSAVVATLEHKSISRGELYEWMKNQYLKDLLANSTRSEIYEEESQALKEMIDNYLLAREAKKQKISVEDLIAKAVADKPPVTEEEARQFYNMNAPRMGGLGYEEMAERIHAYLADRRESEARETLVQGLRREANVSVLLERPRIEVAATGASIGPVDAPVTIIEFSDYQCPFCLRAEPTMWQLVDEFPTQVRWVYRHFPLSIHPNAMTAAEGAVCARHQGKFWELHRLLFLNNRKLDKASIIGYAKEAGLDTEAFTTCMNEGLGKEEVQTDLAAGRSLGVTGTPTFFINGVPMSGALPLERFEQAIREELDRKGVTASENGTD